MYVAVDLHTDRFYSDPVGLYVHFTFMCQESPPVLEATFATVENLQLEFDCDAIQSGAVLALYRDFLNKRRFFLIAGQNLRCVMLQAT